jgi:hypothetical protein
LGKKNLKAASTPYFRKRGIEIRRQLRLPTKKVDALSDVSMPLQIRSLELPRRKKRPGVGMMVG